VSRLEVVSAGPATSVQDRGRIGVQRFGLPPSGAMDLAALAAANALAGNAPFAAAIEIGPLGAEFVARDGALRVALSGAARPVQQDGQPVALHRTLLLAEGERLRLGPARDGVFSYLALEGGVSGDPVFGSLAVNARAGLGSPYPRPLSAGDSLDARPARPLEDERQLDPGAPAVGPIRVMLGPQDDEFAPEALARLTSVDWTVSAASDRMGYRLEGEPLSHPGGHNIVSDGTVNGSIQVPGSGQPIVLLADRGTTGGYPKIATVISADLGRLAQTPVGARLRFAVIGTAEAEAAARAFTEAIAGLPLRIRAAGSGLDLAAMLAANVAGSAVNAVDSVTWQATSQVPWPDRSGDEEQP
jgi:allophanate hydrolase